MEREDDAALAGRIEALERRIERLEAALAGARAPTPVPPLRAPARAPSALLPRWDGQTWLNRLGIALLLLGVGLLFRYSIDQGWLSPLVRTGFGATVGIALTATGLRMEPGRRFAPVLVGGGIAALYLTGWAAFHLYALLPYAAAFAGMVAITAFSFALALRRGEPALAILGAAGGLGTPLLLGISYATPRGIALYAGAVLAWTALPYLRRGWRPVLWVATAAGWALLLASAHLAATAQSEGRWWLQGGALFAWAVLGALPLVARVRGIEAGRGAGVRERRWRDDDLLHWSAAAILPPLLLLLTSASLWDLAGRRWGWGALALAALYAAGAWGARGRDPRLASLLLLSAALLLSTGTLAVLSGPALLAALAAQALVLHRLASLGAGGGARWVAHKLFVGVGLWVLVRLLHEGAGGAGALAEAAAIGAALAAAALLPRRAERLAYRLWALVAVLGWLWREAVPLPGGEGLATIAWGACGLVLLLVAMRRKWPVAERAALAVLLATVAKLFLVDLARLEPLFRVLLFLGFGSVFLYLSYALSAGLRERRAAPDP